MKVLYFFQDLETNMFNWQKVHIIDELCRHDVQVEIFNPLHYHTPEEANCKVLDRLKEGKYSLFFTNVCYYKMLFIDTLQEIRRIGIPTLCLRCDNLIIPYNDKVLAPHFDLVWLTSRETQHLYNEWGVNSFFAPYAANPFTFTYTETNIIRSPCFIGTPYGSRSIMINSLTSNKINVDAYCLSNPHEVKKEQNKNKIVSHIITPSKFETYISYLRFEEGRKVLWGSIVNRIKGNIRLKDNEWLHKKYFVNPSEISALYSKYVLCISSTSTNHTDALNNPLRIVNLRAFEIPMSGGLNICKYNPELADYFEDEKEIIFYKDNDELVDKVRYFIDKASDDEILRKKKAARFRAENEHTWWHRFSIAFKMLGLTTNL